MGITHGRFIDGMLFKGIWHHKVPVFAIAVQVLHISFNYISGFNRFT